VKRGLIESDTHCGSLLGLTPPDWWTPRTESWQRALWEQRRDYIDQAGELDFYVHVGDAIDGPGHKDTTGLITTDLYEQSEMAATAINIVRAKNRYLVRGTGYHTDTNGSLENVVGQLSGIEPVDELRLEVEGRRCHFRHHVGRSDIPYGQYTQLGKEAINDLLQSEFENYDAADVLVRAHVHYHAMIGVGDATRNLTRYAWTQPALQLRAPLQSSYTRKLRTWLYHVRMVLLEIDGTDVYVRPLLIPISIYAPEVREYATLEN